MHISGAVVAIVTVGLHFAGVPSWSHGSPATIAHDRVAPAPEPGSHPLYWIRRINEPTAVTKAEPEVWRTAGAQ